MDIILEGTLFSFVLLLGLGYFFPKPLKNFLNWWLDKDNPTRVKTKQQERFEKMEIVAFPGLTRFLYILLLISLLVATVLLVLFSAGTWLQKTTLVATSAVLCQYGIGLFFVHLLIRIYIWIKSNVKTYEAADKTGSWGYLFTYFLIMQLLILKWEDHNQQTIIGHTMSVNKALSTHTTK